MRCDDTETETDEMEDMVENERRGERTVKSLFQFGAECLARYVMGFRWIKNELTGGTEVYMVPLVLAIEHRRG